MHNKTQVSGPKEKKIHTHRTFQCPRTVLSLHVMFLLSFQLVFFLFCSFLFPPDHFQKRGRLYFAALQKDTFVLKLPCRGQGNQIFPHRSTISSGTKFVMLGCCSVGFVCVFSLTNSSPPPPPLSSKSRMLDASGISGEDYKSVIKVGQKKMRQKASP